MAGSTPSRLLVIVLHEATLDLLAPWAEAGRLPTFQRMIAAGASGRLRAPFPLFSPGRWGNMVTGRHARAHRLREFVERRPDGRFRSRPFGTEFGLQAEPIWKLLAARGIRCGIVNAPLAYPADVSHGFVIQHMLDAYAFSLTSDTTWRRRMSAPTELYDRIVAEVGPYGASPFEAAKTTLPSIVLEQIRRQTEGLRRLLAEEDWQFCLTRYSQVADAQHFLWADMREGDADNPCANGIGRAYEAADGAVGTLIEQAGPATTVYVVSDCGAAPLRAGIQLTTWLEQEGFLRRRAAPAGATESWAAAARVRRGLAAAARRVLPSPIRRMVGRLRSPAAPPAPCFPGDDAIEWKSTRAFALGLEGAIFVNLRGRDPFGIVEPGHEFEAVRDDLAARLPHLADPQTGEPVVSRVHTGRELYGDSMAHDGPDLVVEWRDFAYLPTEIESEYGRVFADHRQRGKQLPTTGGHHPEGIVLVVGPGISPGRTLVAPSVFDLVPTWLDFFGVSPPSGLEGRALLL